ncbi:MAG: hypothetical protein HY664_05305 [Chloroflexi bacterium]|nr:hypothetical protein [Chloroflexota bacterium]
MSQIKLLYELQILDSTIEEKRQVLEEVEGRLGPSEALEEAKLGLEKEEEDLVRWQKEQRTKEQEVEDLSSKIASMEEKLYGGSVKNPKELTGLHQDVEALKKHRREEEDGIIGIMEMVEALGSSIRGKREEVVGLEGEWRREQERLSKERAELLAELVALEAERQQLAAEIEPLGFHLYQRLWDTKQGQAVVKVEQGMCLGCRITLPMSDLQRARKGEELVQCNTCGRILYLS